MNDQIQAAREDLAFLRGLAEDRGPLPAPVGEHFIAIGLLYGINVLGFAAAKAGWIAMPPGESFWGWGRRRSSTFPTRFGTGTGTRASWPGRPPGPSPSPGRLWA